MLKQVCCFVPSPSSIDVCILHFRFYLHIDLYMVGKAGRRLWMLTGTGNVLDGKEWSNWERERVTQGGKHAFH